jgi:hypothetical protein
VLYVIGDIVMLLAILGTMTFTISYAAFFAWRKTPAGRSLMYFVLALDAWAIQSFAARLSPDYWGREWVRLVVYILIAMTVWRLVASLWRSWRIPQGIQVREKSEKS